MKIKDNFITWLVIITCALALSVFIFALWSASTTHAKLLLFKAHADYRQKQMLIELLKKTKAEYVAKTAKPVKWHKATMSMYNVGDEYQTSGDSCITASGVNGCDLVVKGNNYCAFNYLPLGTEIFIWAENHGMLGSCIIVDRTHSKYSYRIDWMLPFDGRDGKWIKFAQNWGVRTIFYKIGEEYEEVNGKYVAQKENSK